MSTNGTYHGTDRLITGRIRHLTSDEVTAEVYAAEDAGREISDAAAVTIASWWQGPREGNGLAFAELASTGRTDLKRFSDDLSASFANCGFPHTFDYLALSMLATWALNANV